MAKPTKMGTIVSPGTPCRAKVRTQKGISKEYVSKGAKGVIQSHYLSDYDKRERYVIIWDGRPKTEQCAHHVKEIEVLHA